LIFAILYRRSHPLTLALVVIYTAVGGLKATFLTVFLHTTIALTLLIYFTVAVLTNEHVGGISGLYNKVSALDVRIDGNYAGSLLTFKSHDAIVWSVVLRIGNFALVVMVRQISIDEGFRANITQDTAFWQKSFASDVRATVPGYTLASAAIIAVPWGMGTVIGLTGRVIEDTPVFKALLPDGLTTDLVGNGMVLPLVLKSLLGDSAVRALLVLTFMAVTSTMSSSMIAVSSLVSFDILRTYLKPSASDGQILRVSHGAVVVHGFVIAAWTVMMNYSGANGKPWTTETNPYDRS
jgi:Na+/proline symporter